MHPNDYQRLAARTECDQAFSQKRMCHGRVTVVTPVPGRPCNDMPGLQWMRINHAIIGLTGEVGELASLLERRVYFGKEGGDVPTLAIFDELGDVLWYVAELCNACGLKLADVMQANIRKLAARYPDKFSEERAADENRDRVAEARAVEGTWQDQNTPPADRSGI